MDPIALPGEKVRPADRPFFLWLLIGFCALFSMTIGLLYVNDVRPLEYFILMAGLALLIFVEIFYVKQSPRRNLLILAQIMAYTLNLIWGVTLNYYLFIGRTDTIYHGWCVESLLGAGHVTELFGVYRPFPLWHILADSVYLLAGMDGPVYDALFLGSGLVYGILGVAAIFLVVKKMMSDERLALLSALFLAFNTAFIFYGMYAIPRSIVMVLFILLLLLLLEQDRPAMRLLALGLSFALIVYHTVSVLFILVILLLTYAVQKVFIKSKANVIVDLKFILALGGMTLLYWAVNASSIIWTITDSLLKTSAGAAGLKTSSIYTMPLNEVFNYSQYSLLILFILLGVLLLLQSKQVDIRLKIVAVMAVVLIPISYPGPLLLLNTLSSTASIGRFEEYTFPFMVITAAAGLYLLQKGRSRLIGGLIVALFLALVFLSITNDFVASDNPLVKRPFYTYYLQESEVTGLGRLSGLTEGTLMVDYVAVRYLEKSPWASVSHILEVDSAHGRLVAENESDLLIVREGELKARPLKLFTAADGYVHSAPWIALDYYDAASPVFASLGDLSRVYSAGSLSAYRQVFL